MKYYSLNHRLNINLTNSKYGGNMGGFLLRSTFAKATVTLGETMEVEKG